LCNVNCTSNNHLAIQKSIQLNSGIQKYLLDLKNDDFLKEIRKEYRLCKNNPREYKNRVDSLSNIFGLEGRHKLKSNYLPSHLGGKYDQPNHIVTFGLNPGWLPHYNKNSEKEKRKSFRRYLKRSKNSFHILKDYDHKSNYFRVYALLFSELMKNEFEDLDCEKWDFFDNYVTSLNLIPYPSEKFRTNRSTFSLAQLDYLIPRLYKLIKFISDFHPKMFVFNGKAWYVLLIKHGLVKKPKRVPINKKCNLYFFKLQKIPCILFDNFLSSSHYIGITNLDLTQKIPKKILSHYSKFFKK